ncbi:MAG: DUF4388 domain-containing protein [Acidobacteriota bacterium]|nr:DUF4388 domain-containing protein [Blastocatellia bacterium]MDW8412527.1 DUF4388 domain-containing protein [Acidobacteriota bacterium]
MLLDVELLVKYRFIDRAISTLEYALQFYPKNVALREKLCEICIDNNLVEKAAEHLVALSTIYAENGDLEQANSYLVQAKALSPHASSIVARVEALRRVAVRSRIAAEPQPQDQSIKVLAGDLSSISLFDVIQIIENSRLNCVLNIESDKSVGQIYFNSGQIADARIEDLCGNAAFRQFCQLEGGRFEVERSFVEFKQTITAPNNTNLILDMLREIDEERRDRGLF